MTDRKLSFATSYSSGGETKSKLDEYDIERRRKDKKATLLAMEEPEKRDACTYDWSRNFRCCICACFSFELQLVLIAAVTSFVFGWNISCTNGLIDHLAWEFKWCDFDEPGQDILDCTKNTNFQAFISTAQFIGATIGALFCGSFLGIGRRNLLLASLLIYGFGAISAICANSFTFLFWARLCSGLGIGVSSVAIPAYMSEMCSPANRGKYGVQHQLNINQGITFATLIALPMIAAPIPKVIDEPANEIDTFASVWWRVCFGIGLLPIILNFYLLMKVFTFDTPHSYIEKGQIADGEQLLKLIVGKEDVTEPLKQICDEIEASKQAKANGLSMSAALKNPTYRYIILLACAISGLQQLSGINVHMATSTSLFKEAGVSDNLALGITVIMCVLNTIGTSVAIPFIERKGRKTLMVIGTLMETFSLLPAAICYWIDQDAEYTRWLAIVGCLLFVVSFSFSYGPVLWVYLFEMAPLEIVGSTAGAATAVNWLCGVILVFVGSYVSNQILFTVFTAFAALGALVVIFLMKETKGRVLGDSPYISRS